MLKENLLLIRAAARRKRMMMVLRLRGWTDQAIGDKHGISRARVQKILGAKRK